MRQPKDMREDLEKILIDHYTKEGFDAALKDFEMYIDIAHKGAKTLSQESIDTIFVVFFSGFMASTTTTSNFAKYAISQIEENSNATMSVH